MIENLLDMEYLHKMRNEFSLLDLTMLLWRYVAKPNMTFIDLLHRLFILHFWKICDKLAHVRVKFVFSVINIIFSQDIIQLALENATNLPTYQPYRVDEQINNSELNAID